MRKGRQVALVGHLTATEVVKRTWIVTIVGDEMGTSPHDIKQRIFDVAMSIAPKLYGARTVTVGLSRGGNKIHNRDRVAQRERQATYTSQRGPGRPPKHHGRFKKGEMPPAFAAYATRKLDPKRHITQQQAYEIYAASNGKLTPEEKLVVSHVNGWGVQKMDKRSIARQFSVGGQDKVRKLSQEGLRKLGLEKFKAAFQTTS